MPEREHFTNILDRFSNSPIHKLSVDLFIHFGLPDHSIETYWQNAKDLERFKSSIFS